MQILSVDSSTKYISQNDKILVFVRAALSPDTADGAWLANEQHGDITLHATRGQAISSAGRSECPLDEAAHHHEHHAAAQTVVAGQRGQLHHCHAMGGRVHLFFGFLRSGEATLLVASVYDPGAHLSISDIKVVAKAT